MERGTGERVHGVLSDGLWNDVMDHAMLPGPPTLIWTQVSRQWHRCVHSRYRDPPSQYDCHERRLDNIFRHDWQPWDHQYPLEEENGKKKMKHPINLHPHFWPSWTHPRYMIFQITSWLLQVANQKPAVIRQHYGKLLRVAGWKGRNLQQSMLSLPHLQNWPLDVPAGRTFLLSGVLALLLCDLLATTSSSSIILSKYPSSFHEEDWALKMLIFFRPQLFSDSHSLQRLASHTQRSTRIFSSSSSSSSSTSSSHSLSPQLGRSDGEEQNGKNVAGPGVMFWFLLSPFTSKAQMDTVSTCWHSIFALEDGFPTFSLRETASLTWKNTGSMGKIFASWSPLSLPPALARRIPLEWLIPSDIQAITRLEIQAFRLHCLIWVTGSRFMELSSEQLQRLMQWLLSLTLSHHCLTDVRSIWFEWMISPLAAGVGDTVSRHYSKHMWSLLMSAGLHGSFDQHGFILPHCLHKLVSRPEGARVIAWTLQHAPFEDRKHLTQLIALLMNQHPETSQPLLRQAIQILVRQPDHPLTWSVFLEPQLLQLRSLCSSALFNFLVTTLNDQLDRVNGDADFLEENHTQIMNQRKSIIDSWFASHPSESSLLKHLRMILSTALKDGRQLKLLQSDVQAMVEKAGALAPHDQSFQLTLETWLYFFWHPRRAWRLAPLPWLMRVFFLIVPQSLHLISRTVQLNQLLRTYCQLLRQTLLTRKDQWLHHSSRLLETVLLPELALLQNSSHFLFRFEGFRLLWKAASPEGFAFSLVPQFWVPRIFTSSLNFDGPDLRPQWKWVQWFFEQVIPHDRSVSTALFLLRILLQDRQSSPDVTRDRWQWMRSLQPPFVVPSSWLSHLKLIE